MGERTKASAIVRYALDYPDTPATRVVGPLLGLAKAVKNDSPEITDPHCGCPNCVALAAVEKVVDLDG